MSKTFQNFRHKNQLSFFFHRQNLTNCHRNGRREKTLQTVNLNTEISPQGSKFVSRNDSNEAKWSTTKPVLFSLELPFGFRPYRKCLRGCLEISQTTFRRLAYISLWSQLLFWPILRSQQQLLMRCPACRATTKDMRWVTSCNYFSVK